MNCSPSYLLKCWTQLQSCVSKQQADILLYLKGKMPLNSGYIDEDMQVYVTVIKNSGLEGTAEADEEYSLQ